MAGTERNIRRAHRLALAATTMILISLFGCASPTEVPLQGDAGSDCRLVNGQWECPW
jgi:hypothetical protein